MCRPSAHLLILIHSQLLTITEIVFCYVSVFSLEAQMTDDIMKSCRINLQDIEPKRWMMSTINAANVCGELSAARGADVLPAASRLPCFNMLRCPASQLGF